ncbi:MAG TPA: DinB family protein [Dehalococcoidia bacterium]|nr:DinB family protein [Dehalococcoidia bacterium]
MVHQVTSGGKRWLLKAVREASGELFHQFAGLDEAALCWRPAPSEWCMKEIAAHLRDAELLYQRQIEAIAHGEGERLPYEPVDVLPSERDYREEPLRRFLYEYESAREETIWLLYTLDEDEWRRTGQHPYRGTVSIFDIARELHEHDLEHLIQARRLREQLRRP